MAAIEAMHIITTVHAHIAAYIFNAYAFFFDNRIGLCIYPSLIENEETTNALEHIYFMEAIIPSLDTHGF